MAGEVRGNMVKEGGKVLMMLKEKNREKSMGERLHFVLPLGVRPERTAAVNPITL